MKKLLAMALIGGLFSLGCTENTKNPEPKKDKPPAAKMKETEPPPDEAARNVSVDNPGFQWESGQLSLTPFRKDEGP